MRFPVDTAGLVLRVATPPREDANFETGEVRKRNGQPVMVVTLSVVDGTESDQIRVRVPGPLSLKPDQQVRPQGLSCLYWSMGERSGLSFQAEGLEPVTAREASK